MGTGGVVRPWSETRSEEPVQLPENLSFKNQRELDPLAAPDFYFEFYDGKAAEVKVIDPESGEAQTYQLAQNINYPDSGAHMKLAVNPETGHHVLLVKGMDLPGRDEGAGRIAGVFKDVAVKVAAGSDCMPDQLLDVEKTYLELLQNPEVQSLSVVGYSIGSIPANYLASVYGAQVTNFADLGMPTPGKISSMFNVCNNGLFPAAAGEFKNNLDANVVGLQMRADAMGGVIGDVGPEHGRKIVLDEGNLNLAGAAHVPMVYADSARENHEAPETETVRTVQGDVFKPF